MEDLLAFGSLLVGLSILLFGCVLLAVRLHIRSFKKVIWESRSELEAIRSDLEAMRRLG